ncbi:MAG: formylglycine-generating enzyme family protein [Pseudomonadota bacterium]
MKPKNWIVPLALLALTACGSNSHCNKELPDDEGSQNKLTPGETFRDRLADGSLGPQMIWIPAGSYRMGDIQGCGRKEEQPVHHVSVERFAIGKYELTLGEFKKFVEATGYKTDAEKEGSCYSYSKGWRLIKDINWREPKFSQSDQHPAVCMSFNDGKAYTKWLSEQTGQQYRLPTEAEWEYAARAGSQTTRYWGNDSNKACNYANVADKTAKQKYPEWETHNCTDTYIYTSPAGKFKPNQLGLYDILGNVWEWTCSEYKNKYGSGQEQHCQINIDKNKQISIRGTAWFYGPTRMRIAARSKAKPNQRYVDVGLRIARHN